MAILKRRITLVRDWSADKDYISGTDFNSMTFEWREQVIREFNDCGVSSPKRGSSVLTLDTDVNVNVSITNDQPSNPQASVRATFTGVLEFVYNEDDPALKGAPVAQIIQVVFYGDGFCSGEFRLRDRDDRDVEIWNYLEGEE